MACGLSGAKPFTWAKKDGQWIPTRWDEAATQARALAGALRALGVKDGERVALVAENRMVAHPCVIDTVPREVDAKQLEVLQFLAAQVMEHFERRQ